MLASIGVSQLIGYGTSYYAISPLAGPIAAEFGMGASTVFGMFSGAMLAGGLVAPLVGRRIDGMGAGRVMSLGTVLVSLCLAALAIAPNPWLFAVLLAATQVSAASVLYDAAFPGIAQIAPHAARRAITAVTLIAGFASSVFWPLTAWLEGGLGWRGTFLLYAALNLALCLPIHLALARRTAPAQRASAAQAPTPGMLPEPARRAAFALMVAGFCLTGFVLSGLLALMVPLLDELGLGAAGPVVAALFGPAQVAVRVLEMLWGARLGPVTIAVLSSALLPAAALVLAGGAPWLPAAVAFALLLGAGSGMQSIVKGVLPLHLFGSSGYAARLGQATLARLIVTSAAPFLLASGVERLGPQQALVVLASVGVAGVGLLLWLGRMVGRAR